MESFIFSLNVVLPLFILISLGYFLARIKLVNPTFIKTGNNLCFKVFLPLLLFMNIYKADFSKTFDSSFILFILALLGGLMVLLFLIVPFLVKDNARRGVVIQAMFRGNYLIFGVPICQMMFGETGGALASLVAAFLVPVFNVLAVVVLAIYDTEKKVSIKNTLFNIVTNPLIIGAVLGILASYFNVQFPESVLAPLQQLASIASPFALLLLGCDFSFRGAFRNLKYVLSVSICRLIALPAAAVAAAVLFGFRNEQLAVIMVAFGAPVAVSSYTMASNANADAELAGQLVVSTSLFSIFTMFGLVYITRSLGLI